MKRADVLLMSEEEVRQFTNQASIPAGVRQLFALGLEICGGEIRKLWGFAVWR